MSTKILVLHHEVKEQIQNIDEERALVVDIVGACSLQLQLCSGRLLVLVLVVFFVVALGLAAQSRPTSLLCSAWVNLAPPRGLRGSAQILLVICVGLSVGRLVVGAGQPCPPPHRRCRLRPVLLGRVVLLLDASIFLLLLDRVLLLLGRVVLLLDASVLLLLLGHVLLFGCVLLFLLGRVLLLLLGNSVLLLLLLSASVLLLLLGRLLLNLFGNSVRLFLLIDKRLILALCGVCCVVI